MAYQARARAQSEILQLQQEVFNEVQGDTEHLATAVFGSVDDQPDLGRISNERIDQVYRQAFRSGNREFLQREARRDPEQFLKVAERIGARIAPPQPAMPALSPPAPAMSPAPPTGLSPAVPMVTAPGAGGLAAPPGAPVAAAPVVPGLA